VITQLGMTEAEVASDLSKAGLSRQTMDTIFHEDVLVDRYLTLFVAASGTDEEKETAIRNWYNDKLAKANIEKHISSGGAKVGQAAPDFTLNGLDGKPVSLSSLKGQAVLINFFATWCDPCRSEMPDLETVWKTYKDRGVVVLAVNLTDQDTAGDVAQYVKDLSLTFPVVLDETGSVSTLFRVGPIPSSYFINRQGVLASVQVGSMSRSTMEQRLAKILQ
jgi:cytochrome c biogenesis protein CcmG, thiol:disulfide interchange protein DsbE